MTFKGIIDLMEMKAYIYNDDKGNDITITDIPEDMKMMLNFTTQKWLRSLLI